MPGFFLHRSNRMEQLADGLADVLCKPIASPLTPEIVVVQSLGMRKWLSLQIASRLGICANCEFPFPQNAVDQIFATLAPALVTGEEFGRDALTWRIMKLLPSLSDRRGFEPVQNYFGGTNQSLKLFQLADKLANLFDQYIVFRPQMILQWEQGNDDDWQAVLWRELIRDIGHAGHQAAKATRIAERLKKDNLAAERLPERVCLFGISSLPPFYIDLFGALGKHTEIHFFVLAPTEHYWGDILSDSDEEHLRRKLKQPDLTSAELHSDQKNTLLASLGKTGRDFQQLLEDVPRTAEFDSFNASELESDSGDQQTILSQLQSDIFNLEDAPAKRAVQPADFSIQIHSCHSPLREMEVLQDQLLALFEKVPGLTPTEIVVMMPDVKSYAPFIEAVFGAPETPDKFIPFTIADRGIRNESSLADALLRILDVVGSRFPANAVLAILETPALQRRFDLSEGDLENIRTWVDRSGIRWGIDDAHRRKLGLPALEDNTWRAGLRRLLLGYALPGNDEKLFDEILPYDHVEGTQAQTLGDFVEFCEKLFAIAADCERSRTLVEWQTFYSTLLNDFFADDEESADELRTLREVISEMGQITEQSGFDGEVSLEVSVAFLTRLLEKHETVDGFMQGKMTFCALRPMRSVPFKVVCLVGMNDGSFPRAQTAIGFDKMAMLPQRGDRNVRDDDRYLFLESMLSVREVFYISYVGQSIRDNCPLTPSVLVSELLDYLDRGFETEVGGGIEEQVLVRHKLQAFSPSYFGGGRLFSYSSENCGASRATLGPRSARSPFVEGELPELTEEWLSIDLETLSKFYSNPAEFFLKQRLSIQLRQADDALEDHEPFSIEGLDGFEIRNFIADKRLRGLQEAEVLKVLKASGSLPTGYIGECQTRSLAAEVNTFLKTVSENSTRPIPDVSFSRKIGRWELTGLIRGNYQDHILRQRCAKLKAKDLMRAWVQHLSANLIDKNRRTVVVALDDVVSFSPVANSEELLHDLLERFAVGMRKPLKFFPATSYAYANRKFTQTGRQSKTPKEVAEQEWVGRDGLGESSDPYIELVFRGLENPLDEEWEEIATKVFEPLIRSVEGNA